MRHSAPDDYLTPPEAAKIMRMAPAKVRRLCEMGRLPAVNVGIGEQRPRWSIRRVDLEAFLTPKTAAKANKPAPRRQRIDAGVPRVFE